MKPGLSNSAGGGATSDGDSLPIRASLLNRLRDLGDSESWRTFFETYWRLFYNVARKSGLSDDAAQDVVQETVIAVARKMPDFHYDPAKGSFKQWLLLITRRRRSKQGASVGHPRSRASMASRRMDAGWGFTARSARRSTFTACREWSASPNSRKRPASATLSSLHGETKWPSARFELQPALTFGTRRPGSPRAH